jgi:hypothetical protein
VLWSMLTILVEVGLIIGELLSQSHFLILSKITGIRGAARAISVARDITTTEGVSGT